MEITDSDAIEIETADKLPEVAIDRAMPADAEVLANLLELYSHDLSDTFALELGADGRFGYQKLGLYWSEPDCRFAFLIRCGAHLAGFALVTRGSPEFVDPDALDLAEFFVVRRHRRSGVGRQAATLLWNRLGGQWVVRVSEGNPGGCAFWSHVIAEYTGAAASPATRPGHAYDWRVFSFPSVNWRNPT